ncbi:MAG: bifunctional metallophosphatase/5'-nucleotidase [bacterium]|nr:bifunctional metallophosphatase/5'-nucleotidase [bacterium]
MPTSESRLFRLFSPLVAVLALVCVIALPGCATTQALRDGKVVFIHWNDFHGQFRPQLAFWKARGGGDRRALPHVGGAASMATFVKAARAEAAAAGAVVVATDGGDWYQGTIEGNETRGQLSVEFFERLGVDAAALGNHEYDFGPENVEALCAAADFPVLGANIIIEASEARQNMPYAEPFHVVTVHGLRIAIVGLITEQTKGVSTGPWGEAGFEAEAKALELVLPEARKVSDVIVLLTHSGLNVDRKLAKRFPEVPLILGGHSHSGLKKPVREGDTWIVQTHGKASEVYRVRARVEAETRKLVIESGELVELDLDKYPPDPETEKWIAEKTTHITAKWDRVIGELATSLNDNRGARSTPAGNLVCDAFLEASGADVAFTNKGGLRTRLQAGPLTPRMIYELLPFDNSLISMDMTGADLRALIAGSLKGRRRLLEIGGATYTYATEKRKRVLRKVTVAGKPLDDAKTYRVVTSSFLARGGDGIEGFTKGTNRKDHGVLLRDTLIAKAERDKKVVADTANRVLFERE